ncbi:cytochrome c [Oceanobacillus halophilus]|uniref:Cytochrome c n=2 Tax=Oceanobacillus halophilus TaxID=930130 RepID=A0A495A9D8_9BACI|nr:cytochrome c [Oceanobacillus halophilus]RKQ35881.1 cytochrome c [Oceanobacillus halophilus]
MKKWLVAILFGTVLTLAACGGDDGAEEPADNGDTATEEQNGDSETEGGTVDASAGEEVYAANCAGCHGADLSGGAGPELNQIGSKLSAEEIADIIQEGIGGMPAQKQVTGEDLDSLSNWLAEKQ